MTTYCPNCGDPHECTAEVAREDDRTRIKLAEIEAHRDIRIAELQAAQTETVMDAEVEIAESDAVVEAAAAEGEAEGMREVIDAVTGPAEPENPEEVVVEAPPPDPDPDPELAPPETGHRETSPRGNTWHW